MKIETESEQSYQPILNVGDENMEESERSEQFISRHQRTKAKYIAGRSAEDLYNFDVSVALTEIEFNRRNRL